MKTQIYYCEINVHDTSGNNFWIGRNDAREDDGIKVRQYSCYRYRNNPKAYLRRIRRFQRLQSALLKKYWMEHRKS